MLGQLLPFGPGAIALMAVYLASLLVVGYLSRLSRPDTSVSNFYFAGHHLGFFLLMMTLYATQYSGNTLFGFSGLAYRSGYVAVMTVHFMTAIAVVYLLVAPGLRCWKRAYGLRTPTDFLQHRFQSTAISLVGTMVMVVTLLNFLLAQLMAMGRALEGLSLGDPALAYMWGVILLASVILAYEWLGGFRAVVWTDLIQGILLIGSFVILVAIVFREIGTPAWATAMLIDQGGHALGKVMRPTRTACLEWFSTVLLVGLAGAIYPQAIHRMYAARSSRVLRRSLAVLAFLPLSTALVTVLVGVVGTARFPGLVEAETDRILTVVCQEIAANSTFGYWLVVLLFTGVLAALMSTADSILISLSLILTGDLYVRYLAPDTREDMQVRYGKRYSLLALIILAAAAIALREHATLFFLLKLKFEILVQLTPAFCLGLNWSGLRSIPTLVGMVVGLIVVLLMLGAGFQQISGIGVGIMALSLNTVIAVAGSLWAPVTGTHHSRS